MGQCLRCVHNVDSLKEQVLETFNDLEFDEVFFCLLMYMYKYVYTVYILNIHIYASGGLHAVENYRSC